MKKEQHSLSKICESYKEYISEHGEKPNSIFAFAKLSKMTEAEFYQFANSFEQLDGIIWTEFITETISKLDTDETYHQYSVREKLLAFYYTLIETLKENRSFVLMGFNTNEISKLKEPKMLKYCKPAYKAYISQLLLEGKESNEVAERRFITDKYPDAFWLQFLLLLHFWQKDTSVNFEKTDSAIEKAVNVSFDLIGTTALDSLFDAAKFFFQNR
jgi:hypothetical protein